MMTSDKAMGPETARKPEKNGRASQILSAAEQLLGERGFDQISIRDVAERAGTKKALVFYYFKTREELFERVLERYSGEHDKALERARGQGGSASQRLRRLLESYLDFIDAHPTFARLVLEEVSRHGNLKMPLVRKGLGGLQEVFEQELGEFLPVPGTNGINHLFATLSAAIYNFASYAKVLKGLAREDEAEARKERRAHILWLGEVVIGQLVKRTN